ncbi:MAG: hypothetical protein QM654_06930 [Dysgonamonadaceae bacterium]
MKKLSKIKLLDATVMNDCEMKSVTGGFVTGGETSGSDRICTAEDCGGSCPSVPVWNPYTQSYEDVSGTCVGIDDDCVCA